MNDQQESSPEAPSASPTSGPTSTPPPLTVSSTTGTRPSQTPPRPLKVAPVPVLPPRPTHAGGTASTAATPPSAANGNGDSVLALAFDFVVAAIAIVFATLIFLDLFS